MEYRVGFMNNILMPCKDKRDLEISTSLERVEGGFEYQKTLSWNPPNFINFEPPKTLATS